jgi:catechol 2,3-dioxygenase-like lactoylglutathione lyase family enzyme
MAIGITRLDHVNVTVPAEVEQAAKHFYRDVVGLQEVVKPVGSRQNMGAWYQLGEIQLHLSVEDGQPVSDRHVCYHVADLALAERQFIESGVAIIADPRPIVGIKRFYVRDPGGNMLEIAEK